MDLSSSRDEQGRPPVRTTDTGGQPWSVKPTGAPARAEPSPARDETPSSAGNGSVWEQVFARSNLFAALDRVEKNAGAPGSDGLRVDELRSYLKDHWLETRASLDAETYRPQPVRRVEIPKPDDGVRLLGIPSVLDRLTAQRTGTGARAWPRVRAALLGPQLRLAAGQKRPPGGGRRADPYPNRI